MKYFLDTEFIEFPGYLELISVALVREDGFYYYAVSNQFDSDKANDWVKQNVLTKLPNHDKPEWRSLVQIKEDILEFVGNDNPEFWGYYSDYDWVVFCWLFGAMIDLPKGWPKYCRDLKQWADSIGNPHFTKIPDGEHNALADTFWNREFYFFLYSKSLHIQDALSRT